MFRSILAISLAALLIMGALMEIKPAYARRGADDSQELTDNQRRGRGRGQDDVLEGQRHPEGRKGQHHLQEGQGQHRGRGGDDLIRPLPDDSGGRGRGREDR